MKGWNKMMLPLQRLCSGRFRFRKTGLLALHREVKACEYKDVHIMWEMLHNNINDNNRQSVCTMFRWAKFASCLRSPFQISRNSQS